MNFGNRAHAHVDCRKAQLRYCGKERYQVLELIRPDHTGLTQMGYRMAVASSRRVDKMTAPSSYREQYDRVKRWYARFTTIDKGRVHDQPSDYYLDEIYAFF